ncbi:peptidoglycan-binding protein [Chroococcidiopsis sp. FACHB-1243]|uniref:peptidoglycan-binding domain-containing protein n=1 Tax=Chroococcidiopsis sp. [FACHB-1243] TaxID=2692781 RepID=UPI001786EE7A|nr:peptidoglycan-binding domain-containing protein [Chroococcidiopsis sp. [FACHB-1243]]MBD2309581.1 peptidoglycan-binding protein [Chroococcidiopsis sp. [FACHB-1243]]
MISKKSLISRDELMGMMTYTNAQLRSILNGLGYTNQDEMADATFPLSLNDSPLTNSQLVQAIQKFQLDRQLEVNGMLDSMTLTAIQRVPL